MMVPYKDTLVMLNYEAERVGSLEVQITPCDAEGNEDHDYDIDEPTDLVSETQSMLNVKEVTTLLSIC